eukprot:TRINITY_DN5425_c0_g1_i1.p1 TRINITY_DN5425_c0_g1~~TRINITY_DN5425_c0_g1_i1.p1  ORF type:complete len:127 (+),score=18.02 TRINITY_DN5425_c0_g1_i1:246-626(+)
MGGPALGSVHELEEAARVYGLLMPTYNDFSDRTFRGDCFSHDHMLQSEKVYGEARRLWEFILSWFPKATYDQLLIMHSNEGSAWAHDHEPGALHAFGDPAVSRGFSFRRDGHLASKRYHVYILVKP